MKYLDSTISGGDLLYERGGDYSLCVCDSAELT